MYIEFFKFSILKIVIFSELTPLKKNQSSAFSLTCCAPNYKNIPLQRNLEEHLTVVLL